jgi:hypothetical protein
MMSLSVSSWGVYSPTNYIRSLLKGARPKGLHGKFQSIQACHFQPKFSPTFSLSVSGASASTLPAPTTWSSFLHFGGGQPLHMAQSLIFSNPIDDSSSRFAI